MGFLKQHGEVSAIGTIYTHMGTHPPLAERGGLFYQPASRRIDRPTACESPRAMSWNGQVAEWSIAHAWKACVGESLPRVRIPLCPPPSRYLKNHNFLAFPSPGIVAAIARHFPADRVYRSRFGVVWSLFGAGISGRRRSGWVSLQTGTFTGISAHGALLMIPHRER